MRKQEYGECDMAAEDSCCSTSATVPARRLPEDFRSEALAHAHDLHGNRSDPDLIVATAAKFEAYLVGGAAEVAPTPKRVILRTRDGAMRVEIFRD